MATGMTVEVDVHATQAALVAAAGRTADLLRGAPDGRRAVPKLSWSVGETAGHLVTILEHSRAFLTREEDATKYAELVPAADTATERSVAANARMLDEFTERDLAALADMLPIAAKDFVAVAGTRCPDDSVMIETGHRVTVPVLTAILLGEQLVHGLDIARALRRPWSISRADAILVLSGSMAMLHEVIDRDKAARLHITAEFRLRRGPRYRLTIDDGTVTVTPAGGRVDCWISADPVTSLLLAYNRVGRLGQILRGRMVAGGRKPWLAVKLGDLVTAL
jgi:hypothetical protein